MRPGWSSKLRVRGSLVAMFFIVAVGSAGMHGLALLARSAGDEAWVDAVYRFRPDAVPSCEQLAGRAHLPRADADLRWARLGELAESTTVDGRCRMESRPAS